MELPDAQWTIPVLPLHSGLFLCCVFQRRGLLSDITLTWASFVPHKWTTKTNCSCRPFLPRTKRLSSASKCCRGVSGEYFHNRWFVYMMTFDFAIPHWKGWVLYSPTFLKLIQLLIRTLFSEVQADVCKMSYFEYTQKISSLRNQRWVTAERLKSEDLDDFQLNGSERLLND